MPIDPPINTGMRIMVMMNALLRTAARYSRQAITQILRMNSSEDDQHECNERPRSKVMRMILGRGDEKAYRFEVPTVVIERADRGLYSCAPAYLSFFASLGALPGAPNFGVGKSSVSKSAKAVESSL